MPVSGVRRLSRWQLPSGPSMPRFLAPLPSLSSSAGRHLSCVPSLALNSNQGTAAQFCPKSTTSFSPGFIVISSPGAYSRVITTVPKASSLAPVTPFHTYVLRGCRAKSSRRYTSAPSEGIIRPLNSVFFSGTRSVWATSCPSCSRASYSSPSNIEACLTGPAIPAFQSLQLVPWYSLLPSSKVSSSTPRKATFFPLMPSWPPGVIMRSPHHPGVTWTERVFSAPFRVDMASVTS